jgi:hypothetical protein
MDFGFTCEGGQHSKSREELATSSTPETPSVKSQDSAPENVQVNVSLQLFK